MDPKVNTSFIPKKALQTNLGSRQSTEFAQRRVIHGPGYFISLLILVATVVGSFVVFGYTRVVEQTIKTKTDDVTAVRTKLELDLLSEMQRQAVRLSEAKRLLDEHIAVTELFKLLESKTLQDIRYTALTFARGDGGNASTITLAGEALAYAPVAVQMDGFRLVRELDGVNITDLAKVDAQQGQSSVSQGARETKITFGIVSDTDKDYLTYKSALESGRRSAGTSVAAPAQPADGAPALPEAPTPVAP